MANNHFVKYEDLLTIEEYDTGDYEPCQICLSDVTN